MLMESTTMEDLIKAYRHEIDQFTVETADDLEQYRLRFIGTRNVIKDLMGEIKNVAPENRKATGQRLNELKQAAEGKFKTLIRELKAREAEERSEAPVDLTLPGIPNTLGAVHPVTQVMNRVIEIFERIGFVALDGPEIESDWYNFEALNFPANHPAREMQDTFFVEKNPDVVLRTHTSSVQIRTMEKENPPIRIIAPGRVYRNEAISARSHCMFHQVEGLYIDKDVSFADLKETLLYFVKEMFGKAEIRLRPSYFPFTEPSAELDVYWGLETEADRRITKGTGWLEILGCGMVDPNVLSNCGIDPEVYTGFAWGMGIERMAMNLFGINDIRLFTENDVRNLRQFSGLY